MPNKIAIIGAGIIGTATAEWLRRAGFKIILIDRNQAESEEMSSYGNAGILAASSIVPIPTLPLLKQLPHHLSSKNSPLLLRKKYIFKLIPWLAQYLWNASPQKVNKIAANLKFLLHDTLEQHQALSAGCLAQQFIKRSDLYYLFTNENAYQKEKSLWDLRSQHGFKGEALNASALHNLDSNLSGHYNFAWKLNNHGFISNPAAYLTHLQNHFTQNGGEIIQGNVADIQFQNNKIILTADTFKDSFDQCVLASGADSQTLAQKIGIKTKVINENGYHIHLKNPSLMPKSPILVNDIKCALTPMETGLRLTGITEYAAPLSAPPSSLARPLLEKALHRIYPEIKYDRISFWRGQRPSTPDSLPLLGAHPHYKNFFFACGHQHIGLTAAAKSGRLIAQMISGDHINHDLSAFACDRF